MAQEQRIARCACSTVEIAALSKPVAHIVCYCDDCQAGSAAVSALGADGGSDYLVYREDRIAPVKGEDLLEGYKLKPRSATNRVVASCCGAAMYMDFDDARHWVSVYSARFDEDVPPLDARICVKYAPAPAALAEDVPCSESYPVRFLLQLLGARVAMLFGR
ncbi:GFA family protein [Pelagibacterium halotolerans]|uniref:GFA family protein n=1 Tax=Pelagibacterium halotolerans TaxID=531813 RepID=UPI00384B6145